VTILSDLADAAGGIAFGIPGGGASLELADAIERSGGRFHTTKFEGAAALMAGAVGRIRGKAGLAVSIKGPGLANLASGLATAWLEDLPVVAVTEAFGPGDDARMHKRLNHHDLVRGIVKGFSGTGDLDAVSRLLALADSERPGPVLVELAKNAPWFAGAKELSPRNLDDVLRAIDRARNPVVIAGCFAARARLSPLLNELRVPVFSTAAAKGVVDETGPYAAGVYTGVGGPIAPETEILRSADLIVGFGLRSRELLSTRFSLPVVNVDDIDDTAGWQPAAVAAGTDAARVLGALRAHSGWGEELVHAAGESLSRELSQTPFLPWHVFRGVKKLLPQACLVLDTGFFCTVGEHAWDVTAPELYLSSGQGRSMGATLPMAVAAAVARPDVPTVLAIGDGGLGMFAAELTLAADEKAPLLVLFMSDGTYASVRDRAVEANLTQRPLVIRHPQWLAIARAFGFAADRVDTEEGLHAALRAWDPRKGPAFLEIAFDPEPYRTMTRRLRL
jgi:acetolactate synthase-1/2/3 large subunit